VTRILFVFLDGVGLGVNDASINAFSAARLPTFDRLLDGAKAVRANAPIETRNATLVALDATLAVEGTPQSGTGQTTLLTGINAAERYGRHFGPWVPSSLRTLLKQESVLAKAIARGGRVAFANAYPEELFVEIPVPAPELRIRPGSPGRRRTPRFLQAGAPLAAIGARVLTRHTDALSRGDALASEITNEGWRERLGRTGLPVITPARAGQNLAAIASRHDLTLFAHYSTDYAGHEERLDSAVAALERVDAFVGGILEAAPDDLLLIVSSDHGNIEDVRGGHTRNPAIGLAAGRAHDVASGWTSIQDVTPAILALLDGHQAGDDPA
jgi:hypothetical protein